MQSPRHSHHMTRYPHGPWPQGHTWPRRNCAQAATLCRCLSQVDSIPSLHLPTQDDPQWRPHQTLKQSRPTARANQEPGHDPHSVGPFSHNAVLAAGCMLIDWMTAGPTGKWDGAAVSRAELHPARHQRWPTSPQPVAPISESVLPCTHRAPLHRPHDNPASSSPRQPSDCIPVSRENHILTFNQ